MSEGQDGAAGGGIGMAPDHELQDVAMEFRLVARDWRRRAYPRPQRDGPDVSPAPRVRSVLAREREDGFGWAELDVEMADLLRRATPLARSLAAIEVRSWSSRRRGGSTEAGDRDRRSDEWDELATRWEELVRAAAAIHLLALVGWRGRPEETADALALESFAFGIVEDRRQEMASDRHLQADSPANEWRLRSRDYEGGLPEELLLDDAEPLLRPACRYLERLLTGMADSLTWLLSVGSAEPASSFLFAHTEAGGLVEGVCWCGSTDLLWLVPLDLREHSSLHPWDPDDPTRLQCRVCAVMPFDGAPGASATNSRGPLRPPRLHIADRHGIALSREELVRIASELHHLASVSRHLRHFDELAWLHDRTIGIVESLLGHVAGVRGRDALRAEVAAGAGSGEEVPSTDVRGATVDLVLGETWAGVVSRCVALEAFAVDVAELAMLHRGQWVINEDGSLEPPDTSGLAAARLMELVDWSHGSDLRFAETLLELEQQVIWHACLENPRGFFYAPCRACTHRGARSEGLSGSRSGEELDPLGTERRAFRRPEQLLLLPFERRGMWDGCDPRSRSAAFCPTCCQYDVEPVPVWPPIVGEPTGHHVWFCPHCSYLPRAPALAYVEELGTYIELREEELREEHAWWMEHFDGWWRDPAE